MTTKDFSVKWLAYALALLVVWLADAYLLSALPFYSIKPMLLPLAAMAVATLEGSVGGAGFGMAVGLLFDAGTPGVPGVSVLLLSLLGLGCGLLCQYVLQQDLVGCLVTCAIALCSIDALRIALRLLTGAAPLPVMLSLAAREILWSLCFVPLVYLVFRWVFRRVPKATVL